MIVGCKCGKSRIVSQKPDYEYGQYYCVIKCEECEYYWEGVRFVPGQSES